MFKRRGKPSLFNRGDSFSESALSSSYFEDTATFDASYFSDGSTTFWTEGTDGETNTEGSYWTGGDYTNETDTLTRQQSPCFGNGFFQGPCPRTSNTVASETQASSEAGCMNFIWESSSDEDEPKQLKVIRLNLPRKSSHKLVDNKSRDEATTDLLQEAFSFVSNDVRQPEPMSAPGAVTPELSGQDHNELDAKLYSLLLGTGSTLLGIDSRDSADSADGSRSLGRRRGVRGQIQSTTNTKTVLKEHTTRSFKAPWNRKKQKSQNVVRQAKQDESPSVATTKSKRRSMKASNPFSGRLGKQRTTEPPNTARSRPLAPARQTATDKRLNDAIMVFAAEGTPLPSTLPRTQSSKFIPSKELQLQMERNIDRESFNSESDLPPPDVLKHNPTLAGKNRSKSGPNTQQIYPLERQASRRSSRSVARSSNRSTKSKGNRSQVTSKSRQTRSSKTTRSRKSHQKLPTNQLSFSDDDGNGFFSVGSLNA